MAVSPAQTGTNMLQTLDDIPRTARDAMMAHALKDYPREACGLLVQRGDEIIYLPCENRHEQPSAHFAIDPEDYIRAEAHGDVCGVFHSHTNGPDWPSKADMEQQAALSLPWFITSVTNGGCAPLFGFGDQLKRPPLLGRAFRYNVTDCYTLIRDWFFERSNIDLPIFPRDAEWFKENGARSLYLDGLKPAGFKIIKDPDLKPRVGDCFIAKVAARVANHAGVYVGEGAILHHLDGKLSKRDGVEQWARLVDCWVRYEGFAQ